MKSKFASIGLVLLLASQAFGTPLSTLLVGGTITQGGLTASNFSFTRTCSGVGVCAPSDASGIDVTMVGNKLRLSAGFGAIAAAGSAFASADFLVGYDLASTAANILRVDLVFNGAVVGDSSFAQVVETALVPGPFIAGQMQVDAPGGPLGAFMEFGTPLAFVRIVKDIFFLAADSNGLQAYATASFVDQFYTTDTPAPEPGTLLGVGGALLLLAAWKRR